MISRVKHLGDYSSPVLSVMFFFIFYILVVLIFTDFLNLFLSCSKYINHLFKFSFSHVLKPD